MALSLGSRVGLALSRLGVVAAMTSMTLSCAGSSQPKKVAAFDLDGTLLSPTHRLTAETKRAVRELEASGVKVVIATGRSAPAVYAHVAALGLTEPVAAVTYNGAMAYEFAASPKDAAQARDTKRLLFNFAIEEATARAVVAFAREEQLLLQYYSQDSIFVECQTEEHQEFVRLYHELTDAAHTHTADGYEAALADGRPAKLLLMTNDVDAVVARVEAKIATGDLPHLNVIRGSPPFFVELLRADVCKGAGLTEVCKHLGVDPTEVVAFGDGDNDIEFLQVAGLGIAMSNARDTVKSVADRVTDRANDRDGVAHCLKQLQAEGILPSAPSAIISPASSL